MNLFMKRTVSVVLCLMLLMASFIVLVPESVIPASALTYRSAANSAHSTYTSSKYYKQFQKLELTGDGRTDAVAVALSQIGYQESSSSSVLGGNGGGSGNYTEYNYNMGAIGSYSYEWCATFVAWALYQSRNTDQNTQGAWCRNHTGDKNYIWREVGCWWWANQLRTYGYFQRSKAYNGNTYKPQPGDLIFFCWDGATGSEDHIGMVVYSDSSYVYTIEGNTSNQNGLESDGGGVYFKKYSLGYTYITGYGVLPYKTNSNAKKIDYSGANPTPGYYVTTSNNKYVYTSETSTEVAYYAKRFTMFEVVGIASNGRLKCKGITTTTGATVEGYILNNEDRVIQITASAATPKDKLQSALQSAAAARYDHYTPEKLATLRSVYNEAYALYNTSTTDAAYTAMTTKLQAAIDDNIIKNEKILSVGKSYTATAPNRNDKWDDSGTKMTDGKKGTADGGSDTYAGWGGQTTVEIVVDLGANVSSDTYRIYTAMKGDWGILYPGNFQVSVSNDKENFTPIGATTVRSAIHSGSNTTTDWYIYTMTLKTKTARNERYVKFTITPNPDCYHVWLEEVEVASSGIGASGSIYVTGFNKTVTSGSCIIFTPDAGEITTSKYNHSYTTNVVAEWSASNNCYIVKSVTVGSGASTTPSITLSSNQILIAGHEWEGRVDNPIIGSRPNVLLLKNLKAGDKLALNNINVASKSFSAAPAIEIISSSNHTHTPGEWVTLSDGSKVIYCTECNELISTQLAPDQLPDNAKTFWVTHTNDSLNEGAGIIITNDAANIITGWAWRYIVLFKPTDIDGVYEIARIFNHLEKPVEDQDVINAFNTVAIPDGGFIYSLNYGNNYISAGTGDTDFTSDNCNNAIDDAKTWKVGDQFQFFGIDPTIPAVSTSTPGVNWYDDSYVCTSYYAPYKSANISVTGKLGDINNDGEIDQYDYILAKRIHFKNYTPSVEEAKRGDVWTDGNNDQYDYILIKRAHFGTYTIV